MNLLLLEPQELDSNARAVLIGRRAEHVHRILKAQTDDSIRAGVVGGKIGQAQLLRVEGEKVQLQFEPLHDPPPPSPLKLVMALPRPKVLKRVMANVTTLGIKEIYLINALRVEKPYWSSEQVTPEYIRQACLLGLEQARDTILPTVRLERLFKPFVQDELPSLAKGTSAFVAHPAADSEAPRGVPGPITLAVGPEGGFIPYEVDLLQSAGFTPVRLGERILKFETAIAFLAGRMI